MRVLMASKALVVGAYQRKAKEIAACAEVQHLTVVVPPAWQEPGGRRLDLERGDTDGFDLRVEPIRFNGNFHLFHWPTLRQVIREVRPDVVHVDEEPYNLATMLAVRHACRGGAVPLFFTWQNLLRRYPPPFSWFEQYVFARCPVALVGNAEAEGVLRAKGFEGSARLIPQFGIDPELFMPGQKREARPFTIGYVARLREEKGIRVLLDALESLPGAWRLHLVADGPLRVEVEQRLRLSTLGERTTWERSVASGDMPARLQQMDALVLPSLTRPNWKEQFGRALVEAMACEVPVVGSDSGEIPNVIGDGGVIVPEGDPRALCDALRRLMESEGRRRALGVRGRQRVLARYTHRQIARQTVDVYGQLLGEPSTSR